MAKILTAGKLSKNGKPPAGSLKLLPAKPPKPARKLETVDEIVGETAFERGLSVRQPFAYAIARGWEHVENRTWPTTYRGFIAIHASGRSNQISEGAVIHLEDAAPYIADELLAKNWLPDPETGKPRNPLTPGSIVGIAEIIGCIPFRSGEFYKVCGKAGFGDWWDERFETTSISPDYWAQAGGFCFLLRNARTLTRPIACPGLLNLWRLTAEQIIELRKSEVLPAFDCGEDHRIAFE